MSDSGPTPGHIGWQDLTVDDASNIRDFYRDVIGWTVAECPMGGYSDYVMSSPDGTAVAGICHRLGANADLPPQWLPYLVVEDLDAAVAKARGRGAEVLREPAAAGGMGRTAYLRDPAGAAFALFEAAADR